MNQKWQKARKLFFIAFIAIVLISISAYYAFSDQFSVSILRDEISGFGIWAPLIFIIFYIIATIFIPSTPFMAIAGVIFGFKYGLLYTMVGGFLSSVLIFKISRKLGKDWAEHILKNGYLKQLGKYNKRLERSGVFDLIILRTLPVMPFNILNILMGVSGITLFNYMIGTLIGLIPSNLLAVYLGFLITKIF